MFIAEKKTADRQAVPVSRIPVHLQGTAHRKGTLPPIPDKEGRFRSYPHRPKRHTECLSKADQAAKIQSLCNKVSRAAACFWLGRCALPVPPTGILHTKPHKVDLLKHTGEQGIQQMRTLVNEVVGGKCRQNTDVLSCPFHLFRLAELL